MTDKERIKAYVIKRDDGKYFHFYDDWEEVYKENLVGAYIFRDEPNLEIEVPQYFKRCQVVPITIQEGENIEIEALEKVKRELDLIPTFKSENATGVYINLLSVNAKIDQLIKEYGGKRNAN